MMILVRGIAMTTRTGREETIFWMRKWTRSRTSTAWLGRYTHRRLRNLPSCRHQRRLARTADHPPWHPFSLARTPRQRTLQWTSPPRLSVGDPCRTISRRSITSTPLVSASMIAAGIRVSQEGRDHRRGTSLEKLLRRQVNKRENSSRLFRVDIKRAGLLAMPQR